MSDFMGPQTINLSVTATETENTPELIAKIDILENRLRAMGDYGMRLRNCIDRLVGPEPVSHGQSDQDNPISFSGKLDQLNRLTEELVTSLAVQTDRLVSALGSD